MGAGEVAVRLEPGNDRKQSRRAHVSVLSTCQRQPLSYRFDRLPIFKFEGKRVASLFEGVPQSSVGKDTGQVVGTCREEESSLVQKLTALVTSPFSIPTVYAIDC